MNPALFTLSSEAPAGFEFRTHLLARDVRQGAFGLFVGSVAEGEAALTSFRGKVSGIIVTPGTEYAWTPLPEGLYHLTVPPALYPWLGDLLAPQIQLLESSITLRESYDEKALNLGRAEQDRMRLVREFTGLREDLISELNKKRRTEEALRRANLAKSELLSRTSHELRTPLNAILGFGQILQRKVPEGIQTEAVKHILDAGRRLLELVNHVLDIAKLESGQQDVSLEAVSVRQIALDALQQIGPTARQNRIRLTHDLGTAASLSVMANPERLEQALLNLLSNGIKFSEPGGHVDVTASRDGDTVLITVRDEGCGIAQEDLERMFDPFERLGAERAGVKGTGMGLTVAKDAVEAMHGNIHVESVLRAGSSFCIALPLAP